MLSRLRTHLVHNLVGYVALFVALGGTSAYAAAQIGSAQIKANAVKTGHIADGQVRSPDVLNNGLTGSDIAESTLAQVPAAVRADTASSADSAEKLDGLDSSAFERSGVVRRFGPVTMDDYDSGVVAAVGSLEIEAVCGGAPEPNEVTKTSLSPAAGHSYAYASQSHGGAAGDFGSESTNSVGPLISTVGTPVSRPASGYALDLNSGRQFTFTVYQRRTNLAEDTTCTFGGSVTEG